MQPVFGESTPEAAQQPVVRLIWSTRGRTWGFRFLSDGGFPDPLPVYESAFSGMNDSPRLCSRVGSVVVLRFPDPEGRRDTSGRIIPHEFVVYEPLAAAVNSVKDGLRVVWPLVAEYYAEVWDRSPLNLAGPNDE